MTTVEPSSPLYLHPSDGSHSIIVEKLSGGENYRAWKRSFEIGLASKRKLGFVTGATIKDPSDLVKQEAWDTCNSMVISWLLNNISEPIKKSVMFLDDACTIWKQLEQRFSVTNGSRKYKLSKEIFDTKQNGKTISEYYIQMKVLWEELDALNALPNITNITSEIKIFLKTFQTHIDEQKLFQFLNGLDDSFSAHRSHLLMQQPLPSLDEACNMLQQEESQREVLNPSHTDHTLVMYSKNSDFPTCTACSREGHTRDKCWTLIGYPSWHPLHQKDKPKPPSPRGGRGGRWSRGARGGRGGRSVFPSFDRGSSNTASTLSLSSHQIEQLMKLLPSSSKQQSSDTEEELDNAYAGMTFCYHAHGPQEAWIIDSGASDHMTGNLGLLLDPITLHHQSKINLPNGDTSVISHKGSVCLSPSLLLKDVLHIPTFKHNLLSVQKLSRDEHCKVIFEPTKCLILDALTGAVKGSGLAIKPDTCSYVDVVEIVGREGDLEYIVGKLLHSDVQTDVSFLSIVGMGGLGKTALAQLVYNDQRVDKAFDLRLWHCVSDDPDQIQLDIIGILGAILALCTNQKCTDQSSLQIVQSRLQKELSNKKYLLVLDDVWTENRNQWLELVRLLKVGQKGSWIVVTTRSQVTANFMGYDSMYQLTGLEKEDSWSLFEKVAFGSEQSSNHHDDLVKIGQKIVEACGGVPLAIRVAGSLVYGQDMNKWEAVQEVGVANMGNNDITQILKLSYHHLPFSLKNCFSFCAIFPKDHRIEKKTLINLWMAHNYVVPLREGQNIEDAGEEHFLILLRRCFFQDKTKDQDTGEVYSVKIHDLLHDIAQDVSRKEIFSGTSTIVSHNDKKIRHLSLFNEDTNYEIYSLGNTRYLRSNLNYRNTYVDNCFVVRLVKHCRYLRALRLETLRDKCLTNSIGELLHLRYLDLSSQKTLEVLPKSITKLCNLEIFILFNCINLIELPEDLSRLIKLRVLDIYKCSKLKYMPKGMDKLTCLSRLSDFIVGGEDSCSSWSEWFLGLEELKDLKKLNGGLRINIKWPENVSQDLVYYEGKRFYLRDKKHLNHIHIEFDDVIVSGGVLDDEGAIKLMEDLHPPSSLQTFQMFYYVGKQMPEWISHLPNLVVLCLIKCYKLEYLECFGNVEESSFLPSLRTLLLSDLPKLKGWRRGGVGVEDNNNSLLCLPSLKRLYIYECQELRCFLVCPKLEELDILNGIMRRIERDDEESREVIVLESSILRKLRTYNVAWLNSLPIEALQRAETLTIYGDSEVENLGEGEKVFRACSSSLRNLEINRCHNLRSIEAGGLKHLSALEKLEIFECKNLKFSEEQEENYGVRYNPSILPSLLTLRLHQLSMMENLPNWMQFLPALQTLEIHICHRLKAIPNWMPKLTSLKKLRVEFCSKSLERRCKEDPPGEDWPYIKHIPNIQFQYCS